MSQIDIQATHQLSHEKAQAAADELAADLAEKFDIDYGWDGDDIHFERLGVNGTITVAEQSIRVQAELGLLLGFMKPRIEEEIGRYLENHLDCTLA